MASGNGGVMTDMMTPPARSQPQKQHSEKQGNHHHHHHHQQQSPKQSPSPSPVSRRPPRACTARTPSRLAPVAPSVERSSSTNSATRKTPRGATSDADPAPSTPMILTSPPSPANQPRWLLRCMWELASIINFLNVFRPVLKLKSDFTMEELESALLTPDSLLDDIHIVLLKAIPPISRTPLNRETWVTALCKKLKDRWGWLAEGPFPLAPYHGDEKATYKEVSPEVRVVILKALCEARLDQDDMRAYIDDMIKQGNPLSQIRKERTGIDLQGTTYWYDNDPIAGQRLYRELKKTDNKDKPRGRGRLIPPPPSSCNWETVATSLEEFETVAEKLSSSKNRLEIAIGKRLNNDIIPDLTELQKKRERALKKQQRQALLLNSYLNTEGITTGRPKRERKPVTYTFDDYDKSISEAIKITKRRPSSPEPLVGAESKLSNGSSRHQSDDEMNPNQTEAEPVNKAVNLLKVNETTRKAKIQTSSTHSSESDLSADGQYGRGRRQLKPQRYVEDDFVDALSESGSEYSAEDDIEGEAIYDDDYVEKKKRKLEESSDGDDEYKGEEEEEEEEEDDEEGYDEDEEEDDYVESSDEGRYTRKGRSTRNSGGGKRKGRSELQEGLRRSQRASKRHVNYSKYEDSDIDSGEDMDDTKSSERSDSNKDADLANSPESDGGTPPRPILATDRSQADSNDVLIRTESNQDYRESQIHDGDQGAINEVKHEPVNEIKPRNELRTFLDLNVAAGVQDDSPAAGCMKDEASPVFTETFDNSGDDRSAWSSPKTLGNWAR